MMVSLKNDKGRNGKSIRRRPLCILCGIFLILFYVTPLYEFVGSGIQSQWEIVSSKFNASVNFWGKPSLNLVDMKTCKILDMDPFDSSVDKFLKKIDSKMKCQTNFVLVKDDMLVMNKDIPKNWKFEGTQCCYRVITRVAQSVTSYDKNADWGYKFSDKCEHISRSKGTRVNVPFIKIECYNGKKVKVGTQFEAILLPPSIHSNTTVIKGKKWDAELFISNSTSSLLPPNILIIGIDSISRLHMMRQIPKTRKYIEGHDFIEMKGYNKVGENTFPNLMAILGGMESSQYSNCWPSRASKLDDCPLLWKNFSDIGYVTAFVEDAPGIAIFNYEKVGFVEQPTDHYLRTLMTAAHIHSGKGKGSGSMACFTGLNPTDYMIDYVKRFVALHGNKYPYFLLSWFTSIAHDDFNGLQTEDEEFRDFLQEIIENDSYGGNNTIILFISDHGYRFGKFRETFLGFYEESLPFFFIRMPPKLKKQFPNWYEKLQENSHRLVSPLDLHETLRDLLSLAKLNNSEGVNDLKHSHVSRDNTTSISTMYDFPRNSSYRRRYSFFESNPINRTCEDSGIPQLYCRCGVTPAVDKFSGKSKHLAKFVIDYINTNVLESVISKAHCHELWFSKVVYGRELLPGEIWNNLGKLIKFQDFIVAFEAKPGKGHFEARIRVFENGTETVLNTVSRINSYAGQSDCIDDYALKSFCMCKKLVSLKPTEKG